MLVPLGSRVILLPVKREAQVTLSGIHAEESTSIAPQSILAEVVSIGPEVDAVAVGDKVLVSQFGPTEAKEGVLDKTVVVSVEDILCIVRPDKAS